MRLQFKRCLLGFALLLGLSVAPHALGATHQPNQEPVVVGSSFCYLNNAGMVAQRNGEAAAAKTMGWKMLQPTDASNSQAQQLVDINNLLTQQIDVLIIHQCTAAGVVPAIKKANDQKVVVFTPDQIADGGKVAITTTVSNVVAAQTVCLTLIQRLGGKNAKAEVIQLQGDIGSSAGLDRTRGFEGCLKNNAPGVKVYTVPTKWDAATGIAGVQPLLNAHPNVKAIYLQSDIVFSTALIQKLRELGKLKKSGQAGHIILTGIDGGSHMLQMIRQGFADVTISQPLGTYGPVGFEFIDLALKGRLNTVRVGTSALKLSKGMKIVKIPTGLMVVVPTTLVTKKNAASPTLWANGK